MAPKAELSKEQGWEFAMWIGGFANEKHNHN